MTDTIPNTHKIVLETDLAVVLAWLAKPPSIQVSDDLLSLHAHLAALRASSAPQQQRTTVLDQLYTRSDAVVAQMITALNDITLPVPRKTRDTVRSMQGLLETLINDLHGAGKALSNSRLSGPTRNLTLWRNIHSLAQHLLISNLVASPAGVGIWGQLHYAYATARQLQLGDYTPDGESGSLQEAYLSALLLGCAQPDSFTAREISFVACYLQCFAHYVAPPSVQAADGASVFWVDLLRDLPAFPCSRKPAPADNSIRYFSCAALAQLLEQQRANLNAGATPQQNNLPEFASTPAGRGVITRLAGYWGNPGRRRFPHRRRSDRAEVCSGLNRLWLLFQKEQSAQPDISTWMITNQSPYGYAIMHVGGKTGKIEVGNITAIRPESETGWQVCIIRWALSENPEHLELGLQILAPSAIPAILTRAAEGVHSANGDRLPVLLLPAIPMLGSPEVLVAAAGALSQSEEKLVLQVDRPDFKVREVRRGAVEEQTGSVEIFAIQPEQSP
jgi:hypothetical protein